MLWFKLTSRNACEHINEDKHLMTFVFRDRIRLVSHLLTIILEASPLVRLIKRLIDWIKDLDSFEELRFKYFCELMIVIGLWTRELTFICMSICFSEINLNFFISCCFVNFYCIQGVHKDVKHIFLFIYILAIYIFTFQLNYNYYFQKS